MNATSVPDRRLTRRGFLRAATAAGLIAPGYPVLAAPFGSSRGGEEGYIDAHAHIWTRDVSHFPLHDGKTVDDLDPASFTDEELLRAAEAVDVDRVVLIAHHIYYGYDNRYLVHAAEARPGTFKVVGMIDELSERPDAQMRELRKRHVTGFRITPWIRERGWLSSDGMKLMWKTAAETGQSMCCLIDAEHLAEVDRMCARFPATKVVIDHMARIGVDGAIRDTEVRNLCRLSRHDNVFVKVSAFYALGEKRAPYEDLIPMIKSLYEVFGAARLMWASDAPYQLVDGHTYQASIDLVRERLEFLNEEDRNELLRGTARRVYWLD